MTERKNFGNVAVRLPRGYRLALTSLGRKPLTPEVERLLTTYAKRLPNVSLKSPPANATRTFVSVRADLAENLREIAWDRRTSAGALLYSLIVSTTKEVEIDTSLPQAALDAARFAA